MHNTAKFSLVLGISATLGCSLLTNFSMDGFPERSSGGTSGIAGSAGRGGGIENGGNAGSVTIGTGGHVDAALGGAAGSAGSYSHGGGDMNIGRTGGAGSFGIAGSANGGVAGTVSTGEVAGTTWVGIVTAGNGGMAGRVDVVGSAGIGTNAGGMSGGGGAVAIAGSAGATSPKYHIASLSVGGNDTCVLTSEGDVVCWGANTYGQLGTSTDATISSLPLKIAGLGSAKSISTGTFNVCAVLADSTVACWGDNSHGQLGNGTLTSDGAPPTRAPTKAAGITNATAVACGTFHSCALLRNERLYCWGENKYGQLGNSSADNPSLVPVLVPTISELVAVALGFSHSCALSRSGSVSCWGDNSSGQLGNGTTIGASSPVEVSGLDSVKAISAGSNHSCALLQDATVRCWGHNISGQLGNGTTTTSPVPVTVTGIGSAVAISCGGQSTCALLADGTARCWGFNLFGQLGNQSTTSQSTPAEVLSSDTLSKLGNLAAIGPAGFHTCALTNLGEVLCWGMGSTGLLGNEGVSMSLTPLLVRGL